MNPFIIIQKKKVVPKFFMQRRKLNCFSLLSFASVGSHCNQDKQHFGISIGLLFYTADTQWWSSFCNQGQM